jgi:hypothetical protein
MLFEGEELMASTSGASADISKFLTGLKEARARKIAAAVRALNQFGEHVIGDAQQITPKRWGDLQASGTTLPAEISGEKIVKVIGFGMFYAVFVHENLEAHHDHGQAKFLSAAVRANAPKMGPFVAGEISKV